MKKRTICFICIIVMASHGQALFLNAQEVEQNLPLQELIDGIENSFVQFTTKQEGVSQPQRMVIPVSQKNFFLVKPVCSLPDKTMATKLLTYYPGNEEKNNRPTHQAVVVVFDSDTGSLQGVLDGVAITDMRTAAATAVAVKHLSREGDDILAIIGTGHQAASHIKLLRKIRNFKEIRVYSRSKERREAFAELWNVTACESAESAVKNADVIVTVTMSATPVLSKEWVKVNALVNIVGAPLPTTREVDDGIMHCSQIIADTAEGSYASAGDIILSKAKIDGELGDVINGNLKVDFDRMRVFKSNGMAIQDLVAGKIVVANALKSSA